MQVSRSPALDPLLRWILGAMLMVTVALSACGGGDESEAEARTAVADFMGAVGERDSNAACALLTPNGQEMLVTVLGPLVKAKDDDCSGVLSALLQLPNAAEALADAADLPEQIRSGEVEDGSVQVEVSDDTATVTLIAGEASATTPVKEVEGRWLVDNPTTIFLGVGGGAEATGS